MSTWTQVYGVLRIDLGVLEEPNAVELFKEHMRKAPKLTGSEHDAGYLVLENLSGYGPQLYANKDCDNCLYRNTRKYYKKGYTCKKPENYQCKSAEFYTKVILVIDGHLRDKTAEATKKEFKALLTYIRTFYPGCRVYGKTVRITEKE